MILKKMYCSCGSFQGCLRCLNENYFTSEEIVNEDRKCTFETGDCGMEMESGWMIDRWDVGDYTTRTVAGEGKGSCVKGERSRGKWYHIY